MPVIEGTSRLKAAVAEYDFATDGGAVGSITLRSGDSLGNWIPAGAVITGGYLDVLVAATSGGAATVAITSEGAGDILAAAAVASLTTGRKSLTVAPGSGSVKTTVPRNLVATIATAALTAGRFRLVVHYT